MIGRGMWGDRNLGCGVLSNYIDGYRSLFCSQSYAVTYSYAITAAGAINFLRQLASRRVHPSTVWAP